MLRYFYPEEEKQRKGNQPVIPLKANEESHEFQEMYRSY